MRRIIFGIILVGIAVSAVAQMLWQPSAESDALFAAGVDLYNVGKYREAIPLFAKSDSLDKAQIDPSSNRRDYSSMWLASCYYKLGDTLTAADIDANYYRFAPVDRRLTVKSDSLLQIGVDYIDNGDYTNALEYLTQCAKIEKSVAGDKHIWYGNTLNHMALCYSNLGNYAKAAQIEEEVLNIREIIGKNASTYAEALSNLAIYNYHLKNYSESIRLGTELLIICDDMFGKNNSEYAAALSNLAIYNSKLGNKTEAIRLETDALDIYYKLYGKNNYEYLLSLKNLESDNASLGNYFEAIRWCEEILRINEKLYGKNNSDYIKYLNKVAVYNLYLDNYIEAIHYETEALVLGEKLYGEKSLSCTTYLTNLAECNSSLGNYSEALRLATEALHIYDNSIFGKEHPYYIETLKKIASYNRKLGNYMKAVIIGEKLLNVYEELYGKDDSYYALCLNNLSISQASLGNYSEAIRLATEALNIQEKAFGKGHPEYAGTLCNLATYNAYSDNYLEAIRLATKALNIQEKTIGKKSPDYALSLNNLSGYNNCIGNYSEAMRLCEEALRIEEKVLGKEHPDYAMSLNNLASCNYEMGNYAEAMRLCEEALRIREKAVGKEHPDYATSLGNLAFYCWKSRNLDAVKYYVEATEALSGIVKRTFADLTARERNLFWEQYKAWFEGTVHGIAYDMPSDSLVENGYNGALLAKGLLLNSEVELSTLLKESGDDEVANIYNNLKNLRLQINKLYEMPAAERQLDTDSLERAAQGLERQLVQRSKVYGDYTANLVIDWEQVRQRLGSGEMAVEFVSFPLRNDSVMYAAYCLRKDMPSPKMVPLFEERQLTNIDKGLYLSSDVLYNLVWKPLEEEMEGVKTVYFAPAGELYNLPIESLPVDGSTYNSDLRSYRRLSSTRQLALRRDGVEVTRAAVYGGLKYDADTVALVNDSRKYRTAEPVQWSSRAVADSLNLRGGIYELPATKIEAEEIDKALETAQIDTRLYTDTIGTEASFKALSGSGVNALHIATHGFYWTEREAVQLDGLAFLGADMPAAVKEDKALTRSGLLLAGANTALKGLPLPEGVEDGVLTAKEIAGMDLRRLDLVALSACQTGLGEITGDGVFGLQRGFKKAGANTLLMSLWKVDDTATQLLMTQFYKNLLSGMGKYEALAAAQKYLRELEVEVKITPDKTNYQRLKDERDGKQEEVKYKTLRKYAAPKYWAAFVLLDGVN